MTDFNFDKAEETAPEEVIVAPAVEEKAEEPALVAEPVLAPEEQDPVGIVYSPVVEEEPKEEVSAVKSEGNKVAIYALRSLVISGTTVPKGYSYITKAQYEKVAKHAAVRLADSKEIATYL